MQRNKVGIYLSVLFVGVGIGVLFYYIYFTPSSSFLKEYQYSKAHTRKIDSLLSLSNCKIDSALMEIEKLKDSIGFLQTQQKISNETVYKTNTQMQTTIATTSKKLYASKHNLRVKESKIDSIENELLKLYPKAP